MLNHLSPEAVCSAAYVENYLDCVENLPNEVQRLISRMRELDVNYLAHVREAKIHGDACRNLKSENSVKMARLSLRMQQSLIAAQELGDEKMNLLQTILDKIEIKTRLLDQDYKSLDFGKEEPPPVETKEQPPVATNNTGTTSLATAERPAKRARRARQDTITAVDNNSNDNTNAEHVLRSQVSNTNNTTANTKKATNAGKKKKRKARQSNQTAREETPPREEEQTIDPDEPTYCLCVQISFGEMIMCDNDLCPIEWFHFSCVSLTTKPKGKWYCPMCRADRPNVMKPKAQFLRDLQRYNKEKEEKT